jgi:hypothetical protein
MPSKLDDASNLRFLHACLLCSDYSRIDYARVAASFGIQAPAARMRFARLNTSLGGRTKARRRNGSGSAALMKAKKVKQGLELGTPREDDEDDEDNIVVGGKFERQESVDVKREEDEDEGDVPLMYSGAMRRFSMQQQRQQQQQQQQPLPQFGMQPGQPSYRLPRTPELQYHLFWMPGMPMQQLRQQNFQQRPANP